MFQSLSSLKKSGLAALVAATMLLIACEKDARVPPSVKFVTGAGYTSGDATVAQDSTIKVGIIADKTEDELKTFNVSYAYDGASTTTSYSNTTLSKSQYDQYKTDVTFKARKQAGKEKWTFTITDRDGNISNVSFTLTVQ